jgi:Holliday junction resolvasome RuvABC DNA-binding subunit
MDGLCRNHWHRISVRALDSFLTSVSLGKIARVVCFLQQEPLTVYGFGTEEELSLFESLNTVSGIGPKYCNKNYERGTRKTTYQPYHIGSKRTVFSSQAGIGIKVASKIILDLKEKINKGMEKMYELKRVWWNWNLYFLNLDINKKM